MTDAWQSIKIRRFEHVSAGPTTSLLRVDGKPAWRRGSSPRPILLVDTAGESQRFAALPAPADPRGLLRAAYSVPSTIVGSESRFWLEHSNGFLTELPAPTEGASRRDPTVHADELAGAAPDLEDLQLPDALETERRADVHSKLAEQSGALALSERAALDNEQARRAAEAELARARSEIEELERRQAEAQVDIGRARAEAEAEIERARAEAEHARAEIERARAEAEGGQADVDRLIADLETTTQHRIAEAVADAERRVGEAVTEADGRIAEADARSVAAEAVLDEAQNQLNEFQTAIDEAQSRASAAEANATDAEAQAAEAESRAGQAEQRAAQAEQGAAEAHQTAAEAEARAAETEQRLSETEQRLSEAETRTRHAEQQATQAKQKAVEAEERAQSTATELAAAREHAQELRTHTQELERLTAEQEERIESMDRMLAEKQPDHSALERELQALRSSRASVEQELDQARDQLRIMTFERDELSRQAAAFDGVAIKARERATAAEATNERLNETIDELQTWRGELERRLAATTSELGVAKAAREADERELKRLRELMTDTGQHVEHVAVQGGESSHTFAAQAAEIELLMSEVASLRAGRDPTAERSGSATDPQTADRVAALEAERAEIARRAAELGAALAQVLEPARLLAELAGAGESGPATGPEANLELIGRAAERTAREQAERELRAAARESSPGRRQPR